MSLVDAIKNIDPRFINEADSFTVGYEIDGEKKSWSTQANSESDAKRKFNDYMKGNNKDSSDYKVQGVFKGTSDDIDEDVEVVDASDVDWENKVTDLEEENVTGNLDGGLGQPRIPHAFQRNKPTAADKKKERENATSSTGYGITNMKSNNFVKEVKKASQLLNRLSENSKTKVVYIDLTTGKKKMGERSTLSTASRLMNDLMYRGEQGEFGEEFVGAGYMSKDEWDRNHAQYQVENSGAVNERRYSEYKNDDTMSDKAKINTTIKEVYRKLYEIEKMVTHASKLKNETGLERDAFWESTKRKFNKISERMLRIGTKLREFNK